MAIRTEVYDGIIADIKRKYVKTVWQYLYNRFDEEHAIPCKDLVSLFREALDKPKYHERGVRRIIEIMRTQGIPIASSKKGYWIGPPEDILKWAQWYQAHGLKCMSIAGRLIKQAEKLLPPAYFQNELKFDKQKERS